MGAGSGFAAPPNGMVWIFCVGRAPRCLWAPLAPGRYGSLWCAPVHSGLLLCARTRRKHAARSHARTLACEHSWAPTSPQAHMGGEPSPGAGGVRPARPHIYHRPRRRG